jgi:hypothetical protein
MYEVCIRHDFKHDISAVFKQLSDHVGFLSTPHIQCRLLHPGTGTHNGLGAVREIRRSGLIFKEEITLFDPPHVYEYRIRSLHGPFGWKIPILHPHGRIELHSLDTKTRITWTTQFHFNIPLIGHLLDRLFGKQLYATFLFFLKRLDRHLTAAHATS